MMGRGISFSPGAIAKAASFFKSYFTSATYAVSEEGIR